MKGSSRLIGSVLILLAALLISCTKGALVPIFYALETGPSTDDDKGLADNITVHRLVKAGGFYFIAANTIYYRSASNEQATWSVVEPPETGALCNTLEVFGGQVYAGFVRVDGTGLGLFRTDQTSDPASINWTANPIPDADVTGPGVQIGMIKDTDVTLTDGTLFVSKRAGGSYSLYYSTDGSTYTETAWNIAPDSGTPIIDVASDGTNTYYWVILGTSIYRDDNPPGVGTLALLPGAPSTGTIPYGGLLYAAGTLYLSAVNSAGNSTIHSSTDDGGTWASAEATEQRDPPPAQPVPLTVPLTSLVKLSGDLGTDVYVGSKGSGYIIISGGVIPGSITRFDDYSISTLYNGAILSFYLDDTATTDSLFACTYGAGLWRRSWDSASARFQWVQE